MPLPRTGNRVGGLDQSIADIPKRTILDQKMDEYLSSFQGVRFVVGDISS